MVRKGDASMKVNGIVRVELDETSSILGGIVE